MWTQSKVTYIIVINYLSAYFQGNSGALAREARLRSTMGKYIYPSKKIW